MKVALLTREYPPDVYGGAGVHVEYLARELARSAEVTVHCWGEDRPSVAGGPTVVAHRPWQALAGPESYAAALEAFSIDLTMAAGAADAELVHSHTWYANLGGHLAKLVHGIPHVATVHSLEPMRPWKRSSSEVAMRSRASPSAPRSKPLMRSWPSRRPTSPRSSRAIRPSTRRGRA